MLRSVKILALLLLLPTPAFAVCTASFTVSNSSTQILAANDIPSTNNLRNYLLVQNIGGSNNMYCCLATTNTCTTSKGFLITSAGGQWLMQSNGSTPQIPGGDLACITSSSTTTAVVCDW